MDENHRRALMSGLIVVEKQLHEICSELAQNGNHSSSILYSRINNIDQRTAKRILNIVMSMLDEIRQVKEKFELESEEESVHTQVHSKLSEIWTILEDLIPEKLEAYGRMYKADKELLRPHILRLLSILNDIYMVLR